YDIDRMTTESFAQIMMEKVLKKYAEKEEMFGDRIREIERIILLRTVDAKWMDHIDAMEQLRQGINLRAYAQRDPIIEYKFEAMDMFEEMIAVIKEETVRQLFHIVLESKIERTQVAKPMAANHGGDGTVEKKPVVKSEKVGRNDPCPCGSGKKYKHCCLGKENN
ncbi:MAG: SEC-C domain-containing protein, partial [Clostridia bacterium]|nr:SEC-C domain-containing protein [Clostridia bacterium]